MKHLPQRSTLFPYTTLFRSAMEMMSTPWVTLMKKVQVSIKLGGTVGMELKARARTTEVTEMGRSEEHTSELQSRENLVCRLLLEKKKPDGHTAEWTTHTTVP